MLEAPDEHLDMPGNLVVDLIVDRTLPEKPGARAQELSHVDYAGLRTRAMALTIESHCADWTRNSARPDGVSE